MVGRNPWPPKGTRSLRPEDTDPDKPIYVSLPDHIRAAGKPQEEPQEISHFRKLTQWLGRIFGRS